MRIKEEITITVSYQTSAIDCDREITTKIPTVKETDIESLITSLEKQKIKIRRNLSNKSFILNRGTASLSLDERSVDGNLEFITLIGSGTEIYLSNYTNSDYPGVMVIGGTTCHESGVKANIIISGDNYEMCRERLSKVKDIIKRFYKIRQEAGSSS